MVGSTRAELASSSLDGSNFATGYSSGPRGTYSSPSLERSGSFRESIENRLMASNSGASRNSSLSLDTPSLSQYLSLDLISTSELNLKYSRQGELRRALGVSVEEHSFGSLQYKTLPSIASEELKRFKTSVLETSTRARDRTKLLQESILKLDKYRNIVTKRRQRNEALSSEKLGCSNLLKMGNQIHQCNADTSNARPEERAKPAIPNRRARSSMAEVRSEGRGTILSRQSSAMDKDKNLFFEKDKSMLRACNGGSMSNEDRIRGLSTGGDGWERKLKRKRSVGTMVTRISDGDRELKHIVQSRPTIEPRSRPSESSGFRTGSANGIIGNSKIDNNSQNGNSSRMTLRTELENGSFTCERRDRVTGIDKERIMTKGSNKLINREDVQPESQSPQAKGKATRASRTGSGILASTSTYPRLSGGIEGWEQSASLSKVQPLCGPANRKRPLPAGSSSPPVTQWVGQRPQKISRTRRANVVSPVSNFDDAQAFSEAFAAPDVGPKLSSVDSGSSLNSRAVANGSHQLKIRLENVPSTPGLSESEESGVIENKREKGGDNGEVEDGPPNSSLKVPDFSLPLKKNKIRLKEEIVEGVRRQGRSGRVSTQPKASLALTKEKQDNSDMLKPLKIGKPVSDRTESRVGRPPSKKMSDRKTYGRPMSNMQCGSSDLIGEPIDDREELLTAVNATRNSSYNACSSSFWRAMEAVFTFISSDDLTFVKNQIKFTDELDENLSSMIDTQHYAKGNTMCGTAPLHHSSAVEQSNQENFLGMSSFIETFCSTNDQPTKVPRKTDTESWFDRIIPVSQRLLSALIMEDGSESFNCSSEQGEFLLQISSDCSTYGTNFYLENELESAAIKSDFELELNCISQKSCAANDKSCNGFSSHGNSIISAVHTTISGDHVFKENGGIEHLDTGTLSEHGHCNSLQLSSTGLSSNSSYACQFEHLPLNDRILLELHSIGIYPDLVPCLAEGEDAEIDNVIFDLKIKSFQQARKRKVQLHKLDRALLGMMEIQERNLEKLAMHKLAEMAYKRMVRLKRMTWEEFSSQGRLDQLTYAHLEGGRGSHGSSHKSSVSKISKQLALEFAKRTLIKCRKFEEMGQSCFGETPLRDALFSVLEHSIGTKFFDDQPFGKNDPFSNRGKKKEALLDDVVTSVASRAASVPCNTIISAGPKWKKSDKDKDHSRDTLSKNSGAKAGRPPSLLSGSIRGERKTKTKPKQKISQLSSSVGRPFETTLSAYVDNRGISMRAMESQPLNDVIVPADLPRDFEDSIFTSLPLAGMGIMDELDVAEGLVGNGQDIGSWLSVDDDALQDHDLVGLEIPMDDLSELKLNF